MATNSEEEKWVLFDSRKGEEEQGGDEGEGEEEEEEEEEEALSLCDLPVNLVKEENQLRKEEEVEEEVDHNHKEESEINQGEDFNFGQWDDSEMCAADDIFFKGQILPFRLSVSSENGLNNLNKSWKQETWNPIQCLSRSESMDHNSAEGFTSFSSRSSSSRSQFSSSSNNTSNSRISKPRIHNQFHTHPSPKPQIRISNNLSANSANNRSRKSSTVWDFFRLGLVRTPEIELQDLKNRTSVSRNSSSSSSHSNSNIKIDTNSRRNEGKKMQKRNQKQRKQNFLEKRGSGSLLSGCSCTVSAVKPVPLNVIITNSRCSNSTAGKREEQVLESTTKLQEMKIKKKKMKMAEKQQKGKQSMSRHRTFEWIKELSSHASFLDHEEGPP